MDMMDNASALPTCPQRNNKRRQLFKNGPKSPTRLPEEAVVITLQNESACAHAEDGDITVQQFFETERFVEGFA
jgi:hypothetical protein